MGYFESGVSKAKIGDHKGAIADYTRGIEQCSIFREYMAYYNRGVSRAELGDHKGAVSDFNKAIKLGPAIAWAYLSRGISKAELGDHNEAIADYTKAIELNPKLAWAYLYRGIIKTLSGQKDCGLLDLKLAKAFGDERIDKAIRNFCNNPRIAKKLHITELPERALY